MKTVVGLFREAVDADRAVKGLEEAGFLPTNISVLAQGHIVEEHGVNSDYPADVEDVDAAEGAGVGAVGGAVVGGLTGLLMGISAIAIPGVGPVIAAGALATALTSAAGGAVVGAAAGAVTGGIVAALVDVGVDEDDADFYAEGVKRGGVLVTVQTEETNAAAAETVMHRFNALDVDTHSDAWSEDGWEYFDEEVTPTPEYHRL